MKDVRDRFLEKISFKRQKDCWPWMSSKHTNGYGIFWFKGKYVYAHRKSWEIFHGQIPEGMFVCHKCDNPICVNPYHLFLGSHLDNVRDMNNKGRQYTGGSVAHSGERNGQHKLTKDDVLEIRKLYKTGKYSYRKLAKLFGLKSGGTIGFICNKGTWKNI